MFILDAIVFIINFLINIILVVGGLFFVLHIVFGAVLFCVSELPLLYFSRLWGRAFWIIMAGIAVIVGCLWWFGFIGEWWAENFLAESFYDLYLYAFQDLAYWFYFERDMWHFLAFGLTKWILWTSPITPLVAYIVIPWWLDWWLVGYYRKKAKMSVNFENYFNYETMRMRNIQSQERGQGVVDSQQKIEVATIKNPEEKKVGGAAAKFVNTKVRRRAPEQ